MTIAAPRSPSLFCDQQLAGSTLKPELEQLNQWLHQQFVADVPVAQLLRARSDYIDALLQRLWQFYGFNAVDSTNQQEVALLAVGGYGRQILHPLSDIDILLLCRQPLDEVYSAQFGKLVALLWDLRLEIGHSVRTLPQCLETCTADLTIETNLLESRLICGQLSLFQQLKSAIFSDQIWPSARFFHAKCAEQAERHQRYHDTNHNLEPDIKNSPGGLRDIDTLLWVAIRHFGALDLAGMVNFGFLTAAECAELEGCLQFLWRIRFALHLTVTRYDNRLLFDRQHSVARLLGYQGDANSPIEQMMKAFYRVSRRVAELNEMLLQLFDEAILAKNSHAKPQPLDEQFQLRGGLIDMRDEELFMRQPESVLRLFYLLATQTNINGIYSKTLRQLRYTRRHLRRPLSTLPAARQLFMAILRQPGCVARALLPMHRHGVLWAYMPQWSSVVGQMQFDLFHAYTVDEHTIRVMLKLESFAQPDSQQQHPICAKIYPQLPRPDLLLLAALFHDIAKGRGGDHSLLGAEDFCAFATLHELSQQDTELVSWLVSNHLLMSITAQRRDIQDPAVITLFADQVETESRLRYLLCLTVADICATNEQLWNSWKRSLLRELYYATEQQLHQGGSRLDIRAKVRRHKQQALLLLQQQDGDAQPTQTLSVQTLWRRYRVDYFLRHTPKQIAWHTQHLLAHDPQTPLVLVSRHATRGGTEIFIYSPNRPYLFAAIAGELDRRNLSIHQAQIFTNRDDFAMDTFVVLEQNGNPLIRERRQMIAQALHQLLLLSEYPSFRTRRPSTRLRHFQVQTEIRFLPAAAGHRTYMELFALDQPGLLAQIGAIFADLKLSLHGASITTIGERVEDLFILSEGDRMTLSVNTQQRLQQKIASII